jgi:hypothetical protein
VGRSSARCPSWLRAGAVTDPRVVMDMYGRRAKTSSA